MPSTLRLLLRLAVLAGVVFAGLANLVGSRSPRRKVRNISKVERFFAAHDRHQVQKYPSVTLPNFYRTVTREMDATMRTNYGRSNVVFVHQNKAAGSTVKAMLQARCDHYPDEMT